MLPLFVALWLAALVLMSPFPVRADPSLDGRALRIVMNDNSPPFSQRREDGSLWGFNVDFAREVCRLLHATCTLETQPLATAIAEVTAGQYDMALSNLLRTAEREQHLLFSVPYWRSSSSLIGRRGMPDVDLTEAVHNHRIAVLRGSHQIEVLSALDGAATSLVPVDTYTELWRCLRDNRADLGIMATLNALHFLLTDEGQDFETIGNPLTENGLGGPIHIVFPLGRLELKKAVDAAIIHLRDDGTYQNLSHRYFPFDIY